MKLRPAIATIALGSHSMTRGRLAQLIFAAAVIAALAVPGTAFAAHPCDSIKVGAEDNTARVAVINVGCPAGREVAAAAYERIEGIVDADGDATKGRLPGQNRTP
jgi:hypothetical protein